MQATGLEKGGIYRHFDSKQKLAGEAFDHAWKVAMAARFEGLDKIPNAVDRLRQFLRNFQERRHGLVPGGCPLLNTAIESDDGNPRLRGKARQALQSWLERLQSIVEEGQRKGEIRPDVDATDLASLSSAQGFDQPKWPRVRQDGNRAKPCFSTSFLTITQRF
jgi:TetR/AcrR family transcriptional regulator, transcriptional repressor for nem operon